MSHIRNRIRSGIERMFLGIIIVLVIASALGGYLLINPPGGGGGTPSTTSSPQTSSGAAGSGTPSATVSQTSTAQAEGKKILRIGIGIDADTLFPASGTTTTIFNIMRFMYEPLFTVDAHGKIRPLLATGYNVSSDGLVYTIKLRKGVRFQDGTPFNATAVKFTFEKLLDPKIVVPMRAYFKEIKEIKIIDPYTVQFILKYPYAPFISTLAMEATGIISPTSYAKLGSKAGKEPYGLGTGPYEFAQWVRGEKIVLKRNPNYWRGKPYFDEIVFYVVPDAQTREAKLLSGELDLIIQPPSADIKRLESQPHIVVLKTLSTRVMYIGINCQYGPLKDKRVRQALNYAVDKDALIKDVLFGLGEKMDSTLPNFSIGYRHLHPYNYDLQKAKELLKEAGYDENHKLKLILYTPVGRYLFDKEVAEAIGQYLREAGIDVEVKPIADWPTYVHMVLQPLNETKLQLFLLGWAPTVPDPHYYLYQRFHSTQWPPHGFNDMFYKNSEVDKLLDEGVRTADPSLRDKIYANASALIWDDAPNIFLYLQYFVVVHTDRLQGVTLLPYEMFDITNATFKS